MIAACRRALDRLVNPVGEARAPTNRGRVVARNRVIRDWCVHCQAYGHTSAPSRELCERNAWKTTSIGICQRDAPPLPTRSPS